MPCAKRPSSAGAGPTRTAARSRTALGTPAWTRPDAPAPIFKPAWKQGYTVGGELGNRGLATLRVVAVYLRVVFTLTRCRRRRFA